MPRFYEQVEAEVDIEVEEFISLCSKKELKKLIDLLIKDGRISEISRSQQESMDYNESEFDKAICKIKNSYIQMDLIDIEAIKKIADKY